jgi:hypothetical protein
MASGVASRFRRNLAVVRVEEALEEPTTCPLPGGIALGVVALILGTRLKGAAILGLLSAVVMVPISAMFAFTACY